MLSFESVNNKYPICVIRNEKTKKDVSAIYLLDKKECKDAKHTFDEMIIDDDHKIVHIPDQNGERDATYVAGPAGSGKSHYVGEFVEEYIEDFPKRSIFLFSYKDEDATLDKIKKIQRVDINCDEFMDTQLTYKDFKNSLVIMDDVDCVPDKRRKNKVLNLVNQMLQIGRSYHITVCFACHEVCNAQETKIILNECKSLTIFPRVMGKRKLQYLLESYFGMDKAEIEKFKNIDSRAVTILKTYPKVVFGEREIYIL
jgi:hypothetical protein